MVPEALGVHEADSGTVTVDTSSNFVDPGTALPAAVSLVASQENLTKNNRFQYDIILDWSMPNGQYAAAFEIYRLQPNGTYKFQAVTSAKSYHIENLDGGQSYGFKIRSMNGDSKGLPLSASASTTYTIVAIPPGDVLALNGDVVDRSIILNWTAPTDTVNLASYEIRFTTLTSGAQWSDSTLVGGTAFPGTTKTLTALSGTYLIKAVDIAGTESADPITLVTTIADNFDANIVSTTTEDATFTGTKTNVEVVSSELRLKLNGAYAASGTYDFNGTVDLGDIFTCIVKSEMTVAAFNASLSFDAALGLFDDQGGTFDINGAGSAPVSAEMFVRIKDTGGGSFGPWLPVMSSLLSFRFAEFKVEMASSDATFTPSISALAAVIDMPDRIESDRNISSGTGGLAVAFANDFNDTPSIYVTADSMATGDYFTITIPAVGGFTIEFFDSGTTSVDRTFDWLARGFGKKP